MGEKYFGRAALNQILVYVIAEGQTETGFIQNILNLHFYRFNICLIPYTVVTKNDQKKGIQHKGGLSNYAKVRNDIAKALKSYFKKPDRKVYLTTMFDYYSFPSDAPGYNTIKQGMGPYEKVEYLEDAIKADIEKIIPGSGRVFFPYLQLHEFETLLFCNLDILKEQHFDYNISPLYEAEKQFVNPELINDNKETAPSKRILGCIPDLNKPRDCVAAAEKIGIEVLRQKCSHFGNWISYIENLV
jgi:hypothetical protein